MLGSANRPTAVFAENWHVCQAIVSAASALGLRIPEDISLIGYGQNALQVAGQNYLVPIDALFLQSKKNTYAANGHNYQRPNLALYLPGNGGLLCAIAMMAAGWDNAPAIPAPGFPREGWDVRFEGFVPMP